jgi:hypothetical protein
MPLFTNEEEIEFIHRKIRTDGNRKPGSDPKIYTSDNYSALLTPNSFDMENYLGLDEIPICPLRVGLTNTFEIVLGKEGVPKLFNDIPSHSDILGLFCAFAGNLFFNIENEVCKISNKSNHYQPHFNAMQYLLIAMLKSGKFKFADNLIIVECKKVGGVYTEVNHEISFNDLKAELNLLEEGYSRKIAALATEALLEVKNEFATPLLKRKKEKTLSPNAASPVKALQFSDPKSPRTPLKPLNFFNSESVGNLSSLPIFSLPKRSEDKSSSILHPVSPLFFPPLKINFAAEQNAVISASMKEEFQINPPKKRKI